MRIWDRLRLTIRAIRVSRANSPLRRVQLARLPSVTGRWAYTIGLAVYAYRSGGAGGVAVASLVRIAPAGFTAPFAGAVIRRLRLDVLLAVGGLLRTAALAGAGALVLGGSPAAAVYALVACEVAVSTIMRPAQNSLLPMLSRTPEELTLTNLALSMIESGGVFLGPLVGAGLLQVTGVGAVFLAAAGAYLVSTLLLVPLRIPRLTSASGSQLTTLLDDMTAGVRSVVAVRDTRVVVLLYGAQNFVAGALNVLIVVTALRILDLGQTGVGTLTAAVGIGGVVGGVFVFGRLRRGRYGADLALGLLLWGVPIVILAFASSAAAALPLLGVVGVGVTVVDVAAVTLLQRTVSTTLLPHVLGLLQAVFVASVGTGTLLAPVFVSAVGARGALLVTGAVLPLLALTYWSRLRRLDERHAAPQFAPLLAAIPIFAPLPQAALDHLATSLRPIPVAAGSVVFGQGDPGDAFYVVERGEVDVVIDGELVRTQGPGESFGEIALLRDVPRTATIVARSDGQLLRLERGTFLAAVTGNAASADAADALVGTRLGFQAAF